MYFKTTDEQLKNAILDCWTYFDVEDPNSTDPFKKMSVHISLIILDVFVIFLPAKSIVPVNCNLLYVLLPAVSVPMGPVRLQF